MSLALQRFSTGDTNYIAKHNSNADALEAAVDGLQTQLAGAFGGAVSIGDALLALLGTSTARIGADSYAATNVGTGVRVTSGYVWRPDLGLVLSSAATVTLAFAGVPAGTYYVVPDSTGAPTRSSNITGAIWSVAWSGSALSSLTALAPIVWGAADQIAAQTSTALAASYPKLDDRLEAGETKAIAGESAQVWKCGRLVKSVAGGANVTLTTTEANAFALEFTGGLTANIAVTLPLVGPRGWVVKNGTTGNYTLTIKGASGAGVKLAQGARTWLMHDGTNIVAIGASPAQPAVAALPYAAAITADFSYADTVRVTLTGNAAITLTGAAPGQKCILELTQGGAGGFTASFGAELRLGTDLTALTLSTAAGKTDRLGFIYDATAGKYDAVAIMRGF